jgi:tripartite-type tricarboxylate transporter receptor subunit TctC
MAAATALVVVSAPAEAQDWPNRPVTMVVPFAAGSGTDVLGRVLALRLSEILGKPVTAQVGQAIFHGRT